MDMEEKAYQTALGFLIICFFIVQLPYIIVTCIYTKHIVNKNKKYRKEEEKVFLETVYKHHKLMRHAHGCKYRPEGTRIRRFNDVMEI